MSHARRYKTIGAVPEKNRPLSKIACDGCGGIVTRAVFRARCAKVLCDECASRLLNGEPVAAVLKERP
jgi:hypothetical protein